MLNKKFEKQVDIIISDEFKEVLKANNDPFYEYFSISLLADLKNDQTRISQKRAPVKVTG